MMDGILRVSWAPASQTAVEKDDILFEMVCRSSIRHSLSQAVSLNQHALHPELYLADLEIKNIDLIFSEKSVFGKEVSHTLSIEPNPVSTEAHIHFVVDEAGPTQIRLFDIQGKLLYENEKYLFEGAHEEQIAFEKFSAYQGVIYCQVITSGYSVTEKFLKME